MAKLQGFQEAFEALEKAMSAISDRIDAQVAQRKQAMEQSTHFSQTTVVSVTLVGMALLSIVGLTLYHNTTGAMRCVQRAAAHLRTLLNGFIGGLQGLISR